MIKLDNGAESTGNEYAKANKVISAVKTGGSLLLAALAVGGLVTNRLPKALKVIKKK